MITFLFSIIYFSYLQILHETEFDSNNQSFLKSDLFLNLNIYLIFYIGELYYFIYIALYTKKKQDFRNKILFFILYEMKLDFGQF